MKKLIIGIAATALAFSVGGATVSAAGPARGRYFVDTDNDGVCDYYSTSCQFVDADGDGICDNFGTGRNCMGAGCGMGYVDADGDGICDNFAAGTSQNDIGVRRGRAGGQGGRGRCGRR